MDTLKQSIILFDLDGTLTDSEEGIIRSRSICRKKWDSASGLRRSCILS